MNREKSEEGRWREGHTLKVPLQDFWSPRSKCILEPRFQSISSQSLPLCPLSKFDRIDMSNSIWRDGRDGR
jgi:hypothetical protein